MEKTKNQVHQASPYNFKNDVVQLASGQAVGVVEASVGQLEAMRSERAVPASTNGLEVICGASCETSAQ